MSTNPLSCTTEFGNKFKDSPDDADTEDPVLLSEVSAIEDITGKDDAAESCRCSV